MSQILLLTKNTMNELAFEQRLRQLGHEVFTSAMMIDECLLKTSNSDMIKAFHHVILSETISSAEVKELVEIIEPHSLSILRKSDEHLEDAQLEEWKAEGISDWIEIQPELEVLREKLSSGQVMRNQINISLLQTAEKRELSAFTLNESETKLFRILYEQQEQVVSREEICLRMWNRPKSNSRMSQLSAMVNHMKSKLAAHNVEGPIIETCWGQGYKLNKDIYKQIYIDDV